MDKKFIQIFLFVQHSQYWAKDKGLYKFNNNVKLWEILYMFRIIYCDCPIWRKYKRNYPGNLSNVNIYLYLALSLHIKDWVVDKTYHFSSKLTHCKIYSPSSTNPFKITSLIYLDTPTNPSIFWLPVTKHMSIKHSLFKILQVYETKLKNMFWGPKSIQCMVPTLPVNSEAKICLWSL